MYGVPSDLDLERFIGQQVNFIGLGRFQIQFHISSVGAIHVEGRWELRDPSGAVLDFEQEHANRTVYRVHEILDVPIVRFSIDAPRSFMICFESGHTLTIYDDSDRYESFSLHLDGRPGLYV
jgi:hypothetical protein